MKKTLIRGLTVILLLAAAAAATAYALVAASLPTETGEVVAGGVHDVASIARDAAGIPVITAANRADLAYATGYAHGQDRFFQMDLTRRNAAGELAELFGEAALPLDRRHRFHRFRARADEVVAGLAPAERNLLEAYANGVNDGLASLRARPFEYFLIGAVPESWRPADTILVVYSMFLQLNDDRANRDIQRGLAAKTLPDGVFEWLYPVGTEWDAPLAGAPRQAAAIPKADEFSLNGRSSARIDARRFADADAILPGSNNWAVAGTLTRSGHAIVANDMHLGLTVPNIFYRARLRTTGANGVDLNGVTLPGAPLLVAGSNGHIAWGNTNSYGDWTDAVIVQPGREPGTYRTPSGDRAFDVYHESIAVKGGDPVGYTIRETIWGPVLDDDPDPDTEYAVSWIAHHVDAVSLDLLRLESAETVQQALDIANRIGIPPQNFVVGDADGQIGWTVAGRIPERSGYDSTLPADWSDGAGWHGWVAAEDYPRIVNPASGRIWTANARVVDAAELAIIGDGGYDLGARARQIRDGLFAADEFVPQDMLEIQLDDRALFLDRWQDLLLSVLDDAALDGHPERATYRAAAENWIARADVESVGYRLVRRFRSDVRNRVFAMLMSPVYARYGADVPLRMSNQFEGPLWTLVNERPPYLLTDDYDSWQSLLLESVDACIEYFDDHYDGGLEQRTWGERNTAAIRHPLSRALPFLSRWLDMPADPLPGDSNLPRAQSPSFGASERFAIAPGLEETAYLHMPTGESGNPLSDAYRAGHRDWVEGRATPLLPGPATNTLTLKPPD